MSSQSKDVSVLRPRLDAQGVWSVQGRDFEKMLEKGSLEDSEKMAIFEDIPRKPATIIQNAAPGPPSETAMARASDPGAPMLAQASATAGGFVRRCRAA